MTKNSYITIICVISTLIGLYRAFMNYSLETIMIPWFVIPTAAILVFWFHGDTPKIPVSKVFDSVTYVTLSEIQEFCAKTTCGNRGLDSSIRMLSQQAGAFRKLEESLDGAFSMKYGSETSESLIHCVEDLRNIFIKNSVRVISKINTMNSISMYQDADISSVKMLINDNNTILVQLKKILDIVIDFDMDNLN